MDAEGSEVGNLDFQECNFTQGSYSDFKEKIVGFVQLVKLEQHEKRKRNRLATLQDITKFQHWHNADLGVGS